jgi:hypothetical protein
VLPNDDYIGQAFILVDKVARQTSLNYGRGEFRIELTVIDGPYRGKIASFNRIFLPHYLANIPPMDYAHELKEWRGNVKNYFRQTDAILKKCGIDTSHCYKTYLVEEIANNNRLKPIVKFNVMNGVMRIVSLIDYSVAADMFSEDERIPDGNDAPLF